MTFFNGVIVKGLSVKERNIWYHFSHPKFSDFGLLMVLVIYAIEQLLMLIQTKLSKMYINYFRRLESV